jgi:hypothetical protein
METLMQPLYVEPAAIVFEKNAAEVTLPEDANSWSNEIMQELYKQVPFISDFEPEVVMDRVDAERGYGFGHVEVKNKSELQSNAAQGAQDAVGVQTVRIPVVIKDRKLYPFDVIVTADSKMLPLNEGRMRQALFRPQAFDVTSRTPGDMSMVGQLYPPYRQNYGGGGGGGGAGMSVGMGKESSALEEFLAEKAGSVGVPNSTALKTTGSTINKMVPKWKTGSVLAAILPSINIEDHVKFAAAFEEPGLQARYVQARVFTGPSLAKLAAYEPVDLSKTAAAIKGLVRPDVLQVIKLASGYQVKIASVQYWEPSSKEMDRGGVVRMFGEKIALAADAAGSVTLADGADVKEDEESPEAGPQIVESFGVYRVKDEKGQELVGYVFPNLIDLDGTSLPIAAFTNGSASAIQESVAGELVGKDSGLVFGPTTGHGMFVRQLGNGAVDAMVPMTIKGGYSEGGSHKMHVETYDGRETFIEVQPNIQHPTEVEGTCIIPEDFKWLPLGGEETVLVDRPEEWGQAKEASRAYASVTLRAGGNNSFSLEGIPLNKLASDERNFLSFDDTLFLLAGLGTNLQYASEKIGQALVSHSPVQIRIGRTIKTAAEQKREASSLAAMKLASFPDLRRSLIKEAAFVPDPLAVDTVLSVGFINPENIMTFVSYLPQFDQTQGRLCELLVAARMGMSDIPTSPLEKCIKSLEEVVDGLKILAFQKS